MSLSITVNGLNPKVSVVCWVRLSWSQRVVAGDIIPLRPNSDVSEISHFLRKGLSIREVMRIKSMITKVEFCRYFGSLSPLVL